jgi:nucleoside-diphosphate-sugar epimerase
VTAQVKSVAVIGAASKAGIAFADYIDRERVPLNLTGIVRQGSVAGASYGRVQQVETYESISVEDLRGYDAVVHMVGSPIGTVQELQKLNVDLALKVASAARSAGVSQFVYLSSLSIFGYTERIDRDTKIAPINGYGRSKADAETALFAMADRNFSVVCMRLPILYQGAGAGKLSTLAHTLERFRLFPTHGRDCVRSVLQYRNFAAIAADVIEAKQSGIVYAADPGRFSMREFAGFSAKRVRLVPLPQPFVSVIKRLAPALHARIFQSSLIDPSLCHVPHSTYSLVNAEEGLRTLFARSVNSEMS